MLWKKSFWLISHLMPTFQTLVCFWNFLLFSGQRSARYHFTLEATISSPSTYLLTKLMNSYSICLVITDLNALDAQVIFSRSCQLKCLRQIGSSISNPPFDWKGQMMPEIPCLPRSDYSYCLFWTLFLEFWAENQRFSDVKAS